MGAGGDVFVAADPHYSTRGSATVVKDGVEESAMQPAYAVLNTSIARNTHGAPAYALLNHDGGLSTALPTYAVPMTTVATPPDQPTYAVPLGLGRGTRTTPSDTKYATLGPSVATEDSYGTLGRGKDGKTAPDTAGAHVIHRHAYVNTTSIDGRNDNQLTLSYLNVSQPGERTNAHRPYDQLTRRGDEDRVEVMMEADAC